VTSALGEPVWTAMKSTLAEYDEIPYEDGPVTASRPDFLAVVGRMFGLDPAPPDRCRVLELGCANGGNLIPLAYYWPTSEFLGLELSKAQARRARKLIKRLGLRNVKVLHRDIRDAGKSLGRFDYIIAHGVYSWVPPQVQERLLRTCRQLLAPQGVAYVSHNVMPGWGLRNTMRSLLLRYAGRRGSARERLARVRELLDQLAAGLADVTSSAGRWLRQEVEELRRAAPSYVFHEYLADFNEPLFFVDFLRRAERHRLQFLGDCDLLTMFPSALPPSGAELVGQIPGFVEQAQLADILSVRSFRQTLLCRGKRSLSREIDLGLLDELWVYADLAPKDEGPDSGTPQMFRSALGKEFAVEHTLTKRALGFLSAIYPNAVSVKQLHGLARRALTNTAGAGDPSEGSAFREELFNLFVAGGLSLTFRRLAPGELVSEYPRSCRLAYEQAMEERRRLGSVRHLGIDVDAVARYVLLLADGARSVTDIGDELEKAMQSGALSGIPKPVWKDDSERDAQISRLLRLFGRNGLLED